MVELTKNKRVAVIDAIGNTTICTMIFNGTEEKYKNHLTYINN